MALRRSLLWIDEASLFETFGSLKIRNLGVYLKFLFLISTTTNLLHLYYINIASDETLEKKNIIITKPDEGNGVVILDWKIYDNAIQEIISDTSKFEKLNEDPTLKREASLQRFLRKLKQKNFFNEIEYDKLYPSGSAPARIYGTPKMHKFSSSDLFPKLHPIVLSIGIFNYNLAHFLCDLLPPLVPNYYLYKDTFSFVSQIKNANLSRKFLVSCDAVSFN